MPPTEKKRGNKGVLRRKRGKVYPQIMQIQDKENSQCEIYLSGKQETQENRKGRGSNSFLILDFLLLQACAAGVDSARLKTR